MLKIQKENLNICFKITRIHHRFDMNTYCLTHGMISIGAATMGTGYILHTSFHLVWNYEKDRITEDMCTYIQLL